MERLQQLLIALERRSIQQRQLVINAIPDVPTLDPLLSTMTELPITTTIEAEATAATTRDVDIDINNDRYWIAIRDTIAIARLTNAQIDEIEDKLMQRQHVYRHSSDVYLLFCALLKESGWRPLLYWEYLFK